jgi:hypothetical protein
MTENLNKLTKEVQVLLFCWAHKDYDYILMEYIIDNNFYILLIYVLKWGFKLHKTQIN